jgi:hypothetical protein
MEKLGVNVNVVLKEELNQEVERQNRVIKEKARAIVQMLPYQKTCAAVAWLISSLANIKSVFLPWH